MTTTYQSLGPDGQPYGPVPLQIIHQWMREGRLAPETQVMRCHTNQRLPAASFRELGFAGENTPSHSGSDQVSPARGPIAVHRAVREYA